MFMKLVMRIFIFTFVISSIPLIANASVCTTAWNGNKIVSATQDRPSSMQIPLKDKNKNTYSINVGQIRAFYEAKERVSKQTGISPYFIICSDSDPNAFASSTDKGAVVGVTLGMLNLVEGDPDMAAYVIAHEYAHHVKQHSTEAQSWNFLFDILGVVAGVALEQGIQNNYQISGLGTNLGSIGSLLASRKFSRNQEREADDLSFDYMVNAGFNPKGGINLSDRFIKKGKGGSGWFYDTHPGWDERSDLFQTKIAASATAQKIVANEARVAENNASPEQQEPIGETVLGMKFYKDVVIDTRTGLMWPTKDNALIKTNWDGASQWVKRLNYGGYSDWHLPTKDELLAISKNLKAVKERLNDIPSGYYWSGDEFDINTGRVGDKSYINHAWYVYLDSDYVTHGQKKNEYYVMPVRNSILSQKQLTNSKNIMVKRNHSNEPEERAEKEQLKPTLPDIASTQQPNGDSTAVSALEYDKNGFKFNKDVVIDTRTGLMWAHNGNLAGREMGWIEATSWTKTLNFAGYNDWRLPDEKEFSEFSRQKPWEVVNGFNNIADSSYWTSNITDSTLWTSLIAPSGYRTIFSLRSGNSYQRVVAGTNTYVWPVRNASSPSNQLTPPTLTPNPTTQNVSEEVTKSISAPISIELVPVPKGCFKMGSNDGEIDETPTHEVCVDAFNIGKYEITQGQWEQVMGDNPSSSKRCGDKCPVDNVSWNDTQSFIAKLNSLSDQKYRLPTEAEWEYACRSGGKNESYCGGDSFLDFAKVMVQKSRGMSIGIRSVGQKQPNGLGIYDMSGNVNEWVQDNYDRNFYKTKVKENPEAQVSGAPRVIRGRNFGSITVPTKSTSRFSDDPSNRVKGNGFRLVSPVKLSTTQNISEKELTKEGNNQPGVKSNPGNLVWAKDGSFEKKSMNWDDAIKWVTTLNIDGFNNWRLPAKNEIEEIKVNYKWYKSNKGQYWSSNSNENNLDYALIYDSHFGIKNHLKTWTATPWPVRNSD